MELRQNIAVRFVCRMHQCPATAKQTKCEYGRYRHNQNEGEPPQGLDRQRRLVT